MNSKDIIEEHEDGSTILINNAPDARANYKFLYWEGSEYYPGQEYTVEDNHTFTAKWKYTGGGTKPDYNPPKQELNSIKKSL